MPAGTVASPATTSVRNSGRASAAITSKTELDEPVSLRRFGLNFDPPSLVLEYEHLGSGKLFHRRIGLRRLGPNADATRTADKIRRQNEPLLTEEQVPFEQLVSVITKLQKRLVAEKASQQLVATSSPTESPAAQEEDPKVVAEEAKQDDADGSTASSSFQPGVAIDTELDLNKLSTEELDKHKVAMNVEFLRNQRKRGDEGFQYDVQVDHKLSENAASCGWDEDEDED
eukprot:CAMPEP_0183450692 /NCGR_PEP_ID=MMETSP0370-20130417/113223_1 /TAXON_ID=268820 /ORGANISM="Peridinium aciculiferum, Strain PAER-2" /LENGTH=228 /DNA_ID=CAMNT_0025641853 /DNA_START=1 /DNA_END=687 /DNA_ORIENTATION=-